MSVLLVFLAIREIAVTSLHQDPAQIDRTQEEGDKRLKAFLDELGRGGDAVNVAIRMTKDDYRPCLMRGLDELVKHWDDPRVEQRLEELSKPEPRVARGLVTDSGEALQRLLKVRARKDFEAFTKGKEIPDEKVKAVREVFAKHRDWVDPTTCPDEKRPLVTLLIELLVDMGRSDCIDLVVDSQALSLARLSEYVKRFFTESVVYARKIGCAASLRSRLFHALVSTADNEVGKLIEEWIADERNERHLSRLLKAWGDLPNGRDAIIRQLGSDRNLVVLEAAIVLEVMPSETALKELKKTIDQWGREGKGPEELDQLRGSAEAIRKSLKVSKEDPKENRK